MKNPLSHFLAQLLLPATHAHSLSVTTVSQDEVVNIKKDSLDHCFRQGLLELVILEPEAAAAAEPEARLGRYLELDRILWPLFVETVTSIFVLLGKLSSCPRKSQHWVKIVGSEINPQTYHQLIFLKGGKNIQWRKDSLFSKQCWKSWTASCISTKLEYSLTRYLKITQNDLKT